jgi:hypothetical protein
MCFSSQRSAGRARCRSSDLRCAHLIDGVSGILSNSRVSCQALHVIGVDSGRLPQKMHNPHLLPGTAFVAIDLIADCDSSSRGEAWIRCGECDAGRSHCDRCFDDLRSSGVRGRSSAEGGLVGTENKCSPITCGCEPRHSSTGFRNVGSDGPQTHPFTH